MGDNRTRDRDGLPAQTLFNRPPSGQQVTAKTEGLYYAGQYTDKDRRPYATVEQRYTSGKSEF